MKRAPWILLLPVLVIPSACKKEHAATSQPTGDAADARIALLMKARTNPFFQAMEDGAKRAAEKQGASLDVLAIDKETDAAKQAAQVETVTSKGVDVILIAPADSKAIVAPLLQAQRRGIRIINLDNRIDADAARSAGLEIAAFIGPDNVEGARESAAAMIEKIGSGKIAMLEGIRGADNAEARKRGFLEAVEAAGNKVQVVAMDTAEWMTEPARRKTESMLNAHPDLAGLFCANDMMALGAIAAIKAAGKTDQIVIAGYDNLRAARAAIQTGDLYATVEQHPDRMGELGVETALKLLAGDDVPAEVPVPTDLITRESLQTQAP